MAGKSPWKLSALISAFYEFVVAMLVVFQIAVAFIILEFMKYLPISRTCTCPTHRYHTLFCCGHFPPFSPCRQCNGRAKVATERTPTRISRGLLPGRALSEDQNPSPSRRAGAPMQTRSASFSSIYRRRGKDSSTVDLPSRAFNFPEAKMEECGYGCKMSADGDECPCYFSEDVLDDEFIEGSAAWLKKQKDRGNEEVILSLLKALQAERRNLRILYEELEEERVASETAANETMAMILRLQEEKSALQMEAAHYQRMAEEKALHDEQAILLLEDDLCRKESERLLLEEELNLLRRSFGVASDGMENTLFSPEGSKPVLLLTGIDKVSTQEETQQAENVEDSQGTANQKLNLITVVEAKASLDTTPIKDQPLKRFKSFARRYDEGDSRSSSASECASSESVQSNSSKRSVKPQAPDEEDDASSILVQLSALEKQLLALEESERMESWHPVQAPKDHHFTSELLKPDIDAIFNSFVYDTEVDTKMPRQPVNSNALESLSKWEESSDICDEERVVNIDIANIRHSLPCESPVLDAEDTHSGNRPRSKSVEWEACEEDKHLDLPSFVPCNNSDKLDTSILNEPCKSDVQSLHGSAPMWEEEKWNAKILENINTRLQALENESTLLRHRSVPSHHEHVSMVLLKEITQELQELLKRNRNNSAAREDLSSMNANVKGTRISRS